MPSWEITFDNSEHNAAPEQPVAGVGHNITGTAGAVAPRTAPKKRLLHRYTSNTTETRDVETQTENEPYNIKTLKLALTQRDETIEQLRKQLETYKRLTETVGEDTSDPLDSREMSMDDSNSAMDETLAIDNAVPKKITRTYTHANVHNTNTNVLDDRNSRTDDMVRIGNKSIPSKILKSINWSSYSTATRQLLSTVFSRRTLATHSLTGKPSPAFPEKVPKKKLDQLMVKDIVHLVAQRCHIAENLVRLIITTKCADEAKRVRTKETKTTKRKSSRILRENIRPGSDSDEH